MRRLSILFMIATIVLFGWAGYAALKPPERREFIVETPDRALNEHPVGVSLLTFHVTNPSKQPKRIIGLAEG